MRGESLRIPNYQTQLSISIRSSLRLLFGVLLACLSACTTTGTLYQRNDSGIKFPAPYHLQSLEGHTTVSTPTYVESTLRRSFDRYRSVFDSTAETKLNCRCEVGQRSRSYVLWSTAWYEAVLTCDVTRGDTTITMSSKGQHQVITGVATGAGVVAGVGVASAGSVEGTIALPLVGVLTDVLIGTSQSDSDGIQQAIDAAVDAMTGKERR